MMISAKNATRHLSSEEQEVCDSVAMNSEEQVKRQSVYNCAEICSDTISSNSVELASWLVQHRVRKKRQRQVVW